MFGIPPCGGVLGRTYRAILLMRYVTFVVICLSRDMNFNHNEQILVTNQLLITIQKLNNYNILNFNIIARLYIKLF